MRNEIVELYKDTVKLLSYLDYDQGEMQRLRGDIEYMLEIDVIEYNRKSLIDRMVGLTLISSERNSKKFRKHKFKHIHKAINQDDDGYLYTATYYNTSLFELRDFAADCRYELRELLNTDGSRLITGTIVHEFHFIDEQVKQLQDIGNEIRSHLERKYIKDIAQIR